jgi:hypothetical protein
MRERLQLHLDFPAFGRPLEGTQRENGRDHPDTPFLRVPLAPNTYVRPARMPLQLR